MSASRIARGRSGRRTSSIVLPWQISQVDTTQGGRGGRGKSGSDYGSDGSGDGNGNGDNGRNVIQYKSVSSTWTRAFSFGSEVEARGGVGEAFTWDVHSAVLCRLSRQHVWACIRRRTAANGTGKLPADSSAQLPVVGGSSSIG